MNRLEARFFGKLLSLGIKPVYEARDLPGRPDFVFRREKIAIFLHGCFWHLCPEHGKIPDKRPGFWGAKLNATRRRDKKNELWLLATGFRVITVWEHDSHVLAARVALNAVHFARRTKSNAKVG